MSYYSLTVPVVAQTSDNTCWHASASMIWAYWQSLTGRQGPMNTLGNKWSNDQPVNVRDFVALAGKVGLKAVDPRPSDYTGSVIRGLLLRHGPLWCAGDWYGPGHIVVLTGIADSTVYLNDPDGGVKKYESVAWFNRHLANELRGSMMYKNQHAY